MLIFKKIGTLVLACTLLATNALPVLAHEAHNIELHMCEKTIPSGYIPPEDPLKDFVPPSINFLCEDKVTRSATITVNVSSPCDEQWRNTYSSNWMWQANRAIERADDGLLSKFGIDYVSISQNYWTSNNTSADALVNEARTEWGLSGADLMIAFTGRNLGNTAGIVYDFNKPYALISERL